MFNCERNRGLTQSHIRHRIVFCFRVARVIADNLIQPFKRSIFNKIIHNYKINKLTAEADGGRAMVCTLKGMSSRHNDYYLHYFGIDLHAFHEVCRSQFHFWFACVPTRYVSRFIYKLFYCQLKRKTIRTDS